MGTGETADAVLALSWPRSQAVSILKQVCD